MADLFELWRLMCATALSRGLEQLAEAVPAVTAARPPSQPDVIDLSAFPTLGRVRIELATMLLLEQREQTRSDVPAVLIVAPYAVHDASIADFALEHSVAQILSEARPGFIALTFWKSATAAMRNYGIDAYLSDLNVAIDDLGGRASLVGLCEGGWLAAVYAARFPRKIAKLVLAGAPIDLAAAESPITRLLATVSPMMIEQFMALAGGRVLGSLSLALSRETTAEAALQRTGDDALVARFDDWNAHAIDLPGVFFLQTTEWLFRENRLARNCFPALGRLAGLSEIKAPIFVLAAADDEVVTLPQAVAAKSLCRGTSVAIRVEPGGHLSLFMGRRTLDGAWREIAHWLRRGIATACHDPASQAG